MQIQKYKIINLNSIQAAATEPFRSINGKLFLQWNTLLEIQCEYHKILFPAINERLSLLRYNNHIFVVGTFQSLSPPFSE
ncbi:hypothetical protein HZS_3313 [Henneguya salminicola]|nr:hypothetical protein HZS_3313 [Henneguya salminicola]